MCCDDVYDVLCRVESYVGDRVSKRGHFGLIFSSWKYSCTYFEVVVVVFRAFVIAIIFCVSEFLV